jgi:hypothetical protein
MLAPGTVLVFREAVSRLQSPDLVSRGLAAELLADQEQPHAIQQLLARLHQIQDLARYKNICTVIYSSVVDPHWFICKFWSISMLLRGSRSGSVFGIRIQEGKNDPQTKLHVVKCWMFSFES